LKIYEFYENEKNFYLICEYCGDGDLYDKIVSNAPFNEYVSSHLMRQILSALHYCHSQNIVHRDIRPENFLVESTEKIETPEGVYDFYNVRMKDFSSARSFKKTKKLTKKVGTVKYSTVIIKNSHVILHQKFLRDHTMKNVIFGVVEFYFLSYFAESLLFSQKLKRKFLKR